MTQNQTKIKILLIEDEEVLTNLLQEKLTSEGYQVATAANGLEGLEKMKQDKPDLVLLDIIMPKMGGFEVMEEMKKDNVLAKILVMIISNSGQPVELERARKLGAKDWLIKTQFDPKEVTEKVNNLISKLMADNEKKKKVLIVEDEKFLRDLLNLKLQAEGFAVSTAIEGREALQKIKNDPPQLVLLDLVLPGLDGFEVLKKMRKDPLTAKIPVIIVSNLGQKEEIDRGLLLGANDYMVKANFTPQHIVDQIKRYLNI